LNYVFSDSASMTEYAARRLSTLAQGAVAGRNRFLLALSGGSTPQALYELLAEPLWLDAIPWSHTHVLWGDERCVPPDSTDSNFRQAKKALLDHVPVQPDHVHRIHGEWQPNKAADDYAKQLRALAEPGRSWPRLDLVLLGMGSDGHTASLFPGQVSREEMTEPVVAVTAEYDGRPANRVTLTPRILNDAHHVIFLVSGASKASALAEVLEGDYQPKAYPAQRIRPKYGTLTWLVDEAAASQLKNPLTQR
jgi:6-phosphogluconolactonase